MSPANDRRSTLRRLMAAVILLGSAASGRTEQLADRIRNAPPGATIEVPVGRHALGGIQVPPGVSLRGAGYRATTLDATGHEFGLAVRDGKGATIADLAVTGASEAIKIVGGSGIVIERVRLAGSVAALESGGYP